MRKKSYIKVSKKSQKKNLKKNKKNSNKVSKNFIIFFFISIAKKSFYLGKQCPMIMAGAGAESTLESQKMCETMALAGADCFLIVPPSFYPLSPSAMEKHFKEVADFSPKPIIIHNVPDHTGLDDHT